MSNFFERVPFLSGWSVPSKFHEWDRTIPVSDGGKTVELRVSFWPDERKDRKIHAELAGGNLSTPVLWGWDGSTWYVRNGTAYRIPNGTSVNATRLRSELFYGITKEEIHAFGPDGLVRSSKLPKSLDGLGNPFQWVGVFASGETDDSPVLGVKIGQNRGLWLFDSELRFLTSGTTTEFYPADVWCDSVKDAEGNVLDLTSNRDRAKLKVTRIG